MADTESPQEETPSQRQARIRREKREKKILTGGADRLAKITNVSGRQAEPAPLTDPNPASPEPTSSDDPAEPDIRTASYPRSQQAQPSAPTEADLRNFLRSTADPNADPAQTQQEPDIMAMMQQLMAGAGGGGGGPGGPPGAGPGAPGFPPSGEMPGLPPALAAMLSGAPGGAPAPDQASSTRAYTWKIAHFLSAAGLAIWILVTHPFSGTLAARSLDPDIFSPTRDEAGGGSTQAAQRVFYVFATMQIVLQSTRLFVDRSAPETGMLAKVAGFLPRPWGQRVRMAGRYAGIWTTLVADVMVVVWVLGVVAWWRGVGA